MAKTTGDVPQFAMAVAVSLTAGLIAILTLSAWSADAETATYLGFLLIVVTCGLGGVLRGALSEVLVLSLVISTTFSTSIVLGGNPFAYPGSLGPWLWLVHLPLFGGLIVGLGRGWITVHSISVGQLTLGLFVGWTFLGATLGSPVRPEVARHFVLYVLQGWIAFAVLSGAVREAVVSLRSVAAAFATAVSGQALVGIAQFLVQNDLQIRRIALGSTRHIADISLPIFGTYSIGPYVSGFAVAGSISGVLALGFPLAIVFAHGTRAKGRILAAGSAVAIALTARVTAWDSARGALLLELLALAGVGLYLSWIRRRDSLLTEIKKATKPLQIAVPLATMALLFPSSASGSPAGDGGAGTSSISIPFFSLANAPIRLQQIVAGVMVFLDRPLFGVGGASFYYVATDYGLPRPLHLHNLFAGLLAETGLPGLVLYSATLGIVFVRGGQFVLGSDGEADADASLVLGLMVALGGYLALLFWQPQILRITSFLAFWVLAGAVDGRVAAPLLDGH